MDPREHVLEALSLRPSETPPVAIFTQSATVGQMEAVGAYWPQAHSDPAAMARLGCAQAELFGFESVRVPFDITAEAERLGCGVDLGTEKDIPSISDRAYLVDTYVGTLPSPDGLMSPSEFIEGGRPKTIMKAVELAASRFGATYPVCAGMLGPVTLLSQLIGAENLAISTLLEPDWADSWCTRLSGICGTYSRALCDSGADVITVVEGVASPDVIDPSSFEGLCGKHLHDLVPQEAKSILHICGSTEPILGEIATSGMDAFSPDPKVDPHTAMRVLEGRMALCGAVDPVGTLLFGTPEQVVHEARRYAEIGYHVIAPGCGLAPETPDTNLKALSAALR